MDFGDYANKAMGSVKPKICENCGHKNKHNAKICDVCGIHLD